MKPNIHPQYFETQVTCGCGNTFTVGSTKQTLRVEICNKCHPFFTGEMKFIDALGRVERFQKRQQHAQTLAPIIAAKKKKKLDKDASDKTPKTLREMLLGTN